MAKYIITIFKFTLMILIIINTSAFAFAEYGKFDYSESWCNYPVLSSNGSKLYLSCTMDNLVREIDTETMQVIRSFPIEIPYDIIINNDNSYLYVASISQWPTSYICRIRLTDGNQEHLSLNGDTTGLAKNNNIHYIWAIHYTWPAPGEFITEDEAICEHAGSALITKISTETFSIVQARQGWVLPSSAWYCNYSGDLYVAHEWGTIYPDRVNGAAIAVFDGDTLECVGQTIGGDNYANHLWIPINICNWTDNGRFAAIPNMVADLNKCSLKIIDTTRESGFKEFEPEFELTFNNPITGKILGTEFIKKVPGKDILWATSSDGNPPDAPDRARYVIKVNTATHAYEVFEVPEATSDFGYFDVSSDGRILYLTQPKTGEVIKCCPDNLAPICSLVVVTPIPLVPVPAPFAVEFDASGTTDPNGDTLTFEWDFDGDSIFSEPVDDAYTGEPNHPTHLYYEDYDGPVKMKVKDPYDGRCGAAVHIRIDIE